MNGPALGYNETQNDAATGALFLFYPKIIKSAGIPQCDEIPMNGFRIEDITLFAVDQCAQSLLGHAPLTTKLNRFDSVFPNRSRLHLLRRSRRRSRSGGLVFLLR